MASETPFPLQVHRPSRQNYPCDYTALFIRAQQLHACELHMGQPSRILSSVFNGMGQRTRGMPSET